MNTGSTTTKMKNTFIIALIITTAALTSCCSSSQKNKAKQTSQTAAETSQTAPVAQESSREFKPLAADGANLSVNHSYLTEENVGESITVRGKLLQNGSAFSLIENPDSKSRVTFVLTFENDAVKNQLTAKANSLVQVSGVLTSADSTWKKGMKVLQVE